MVIMKYKKLVILCKGNFVIEDPELVRQQSLIDMCEDSLRWQKSYITTNR
jgi:hypothetical protein